MVELCGARPVGGLIDVGGPGPEAAVIRLREARVEALLGLAIPRDEQAEILERLGFGVAQADDGLDVTVPHWRRNDVTREADLVEEVGRIWGYEKLPTTLPSRRGVSGRLEPAQRLRRRAEDALVGAGVSEILGWSFAAPNLVERLGIPADDPRSRVVKLANPMSEDQSVLRTSLLGPLLDNVERNRARGNEDVRLWQYGAIYLARDARRRQRRGRRRPVPGLDRLPTERQHLAALLTGHLRPPTLARVRARAGRLLRRQGRARRALMAALRVPWEVEPSREPFLHPGRSARVLAGGEPAGWLGELHPAVAARWDVEQAAGFELDFGVLAEHAVLTPDYEDLTSFPAVRQDMAIVVPDGVSAAQVVAVVRKAGGALLRRAEVFDVYRGAQVGEGVGVAGAAARVPRPRPHADRRGGRPAAREDRRRAVRAARSAAAWLRSPSSERPATRARSRRRCCGATRSSSSSTSPRAPRRARCSTRSTRARACRSCSRTGTRTCRARSTRRSCAGRTASPRPPSPRCASAACGSSTCRPTSGCATRTVYEDWYGKHGAPELFGAAVYGLPELYREAVAGADLVANPGCYPTAALLGLAPLARAGAIADVVIDAKSGVSGAGRSPTADHPLHLGRREHDARTRSSATATRRRSSRSSAVLGASLPITFTPHLVPLAQGELVSSYVTPAMRAGGGRARRPLPRGLRRRAVGRGRARAARRARGARHELLPHLGPPRRPDRAGAGVLRDRQPVEGRRVAGGAEPQPDVRARRERGAAMSVGASRWVSLPDHAVDAEGGLPQGFRAAGRRLRAQAERRHGHGPARLRHGRDGERGALHALGRARRAR